MTEQWETHRVQLVYPLNIQYPKKKWLTGLFHTRSKRTLRCCRSESECRERFLQCRRADSPTNLSYVLTSQINRIMSPHWDKNRLLLWEEMIVFMNPVSGHNSLSEECRVVRQLLDFLVFWCSPAYTHTLTLTFWFKPTGINYIMCWWTFGLQLYSCFLKNFWDYEWSRIQDVWMLNEVKSTVYGWRWRANL